MSALRLSDATYDAGLAVEALGVARAGALIVTGASFALAPGAALLLKGANGSGKTTLLRALAGLLPIAEGCAVLTRGGSRSETPSARRAAAIYCGHADGVKAALTAREHLAFWSALYRARAARTQETIDAFDLGGLLSLRAAVLSAGQRRRLGLARSVLSGKPIWLLDEPAAGMDAASCARLVALIGVHCARGGAAIVATHDRIDLEGARTLTLHAPEPRP